MTPQLQQAIKLLQLSTLDLQQEIQQALESNPMLDVNEEHEAEPSGDTEQVKSEQVDFSDNTEVKTDKSSNTGRVKLLNAMQYGDDFI